MGRWTKTLQPVTICESVRVFGGEMMGFGGGSVDL
jgi:hypothetical protein